jgi:gliding motility-associated-like protein
LGDYDPTIDLIIDPQIAFSTYIGSTANNFGFTACDDLNQNLIAGAAVFQANYPVTPGAYDSTFNGPTGPQFTIAGFDVGLTKFSSDGSQLLYCSYFGGNSQETPHSIVVNSANQFIVMGMTGSNNFPTTSGVYQGTLIGGPAVMISQFFTGSEMTNGCDLYLAKFNNDGTLSASTFVGGTNTDGLNIGNNLFFNYGDTFRGEVNIDTNDNVFVASVSSGGFPVTLGAPQTAYGGGISDGVLFKMDAALTSMLWSTYLGGSGDDACYAIQFGSDGSIYVGGGTSSANLQPASGASMAYNGAVDGFILRVNPITLTFSAFSFIGTADYDQCYFVQTDLSGNVYALGQTEGTMPVSPGRYGQADSGLFIRKFDGSLTTMLWNTTIGTSSGHADISPTAFLVSDCDQIYFSGWGGEVNSGNCGFYGCGALNSTTNGLPVTANAFQTSTDGSDFYLCVLSPDATSLVYATFLGGSVSPEHVDGGTSRFDKSGSVYQAVCAGCQGNSDFPTTPGAWSAQNPSGRCNLAVFRFDLGKAIADINIDGPNQVCVNTPVSFVNASSNANAYQWNFGDNASSTQFEPTHTYTSPGTYTITLIAGISSETCSLPDTAQVQITILPGVNPTIQASTGICPGFVAQLSATGSANAFWIPNPTLSNASALNPIATPTETTTYFFVDSNACEAETLSVVVEVYPLNVAVSDNDSICISQSVPLIASGGSSYQWSPSAGLSSTTIANPIAQPIVSTTYQVVVTTIHGCVATDSVFIYVYDGAPGGDVYPDLNVCAGESVQLAAHPASSYQWSPAIWLTNPASQTPFASPPDTTVFFVNLINPCGSGTDQVQVNVIFPEGNASGGGTVCRGNGLPASANGGIRYRWSPATFADPPDSSFTIVSPPTTQWMRVSITNSNGCVATDSVLVNVLDLPDVSAGPPLFLDIGECGYLDGNNFGFTYYWSPLEGLSCTDCLNPFICPETERYYILTVTDGQGCIARDSVLVRPYSPLYVPNTITPDNDGINDYFKAVGNNITGFHLIIYDRWGMKVFESYDINKVWNGGIDGYYVQNDTYVWEIEYDSMERRTKLKGHVNVIR